MPGAAGHHPVYLSNLLIQMSFMDETLTLECENVDTRKAAVALGVQKAVELHQYWTRLYSVLYICPNCLMQMSFVDDSVSVDQARERGHMHIADFVAHAHKFQVSR